ncbi:MAG: ATP-binding protein [Oscillatoriaceae bacterium SKW80]|nr:ATP-binding protein [Oscillatoriaceae bacterium SKYG93]MCX8119770.1 ATP-binding protein [Oscillatoriaceae bacterium SKW80]MDW8452353.1 ATP-binding protein [Oscillatoriaceae cyanobacterium SKYGB_i_bin93]HIK27674.1 GAF domain-containing protein [Oscillatoriaceae cyanobacterium M7585_C2015_266]
MTSEADFHTSVAETSGLVPKGEDNSSPLQSLGAELAFTQDATGLCKSFYWQQAKQYGVEAQRVVGSRMTEMFMPVAPVPYLERIRRVLESLIPERFSYPFRVGENYLIFDLIVSPIMNPTEAVNTVLVMGRQISPAGWIQKSERSREETELILKVNGWDLHQKLLSEIVGSIRRTLPPAAELYQKLLSKIARDIRRTLDFETICQQTAQELGQAMGVSRCIVCSYKDTANFVQVIAEYRQEPFVSMLGQKLQLASEPYLQRALASLQPVAVEQVPANEFGNQSLLLVATCYQERANGLIGLYQCDKSRPWSVAEIEFVQELAEQVGTAVAHALLYKQLQEAREQAEAVSRLKSEFLANTSHELRTPLNGIIGFLKLISDGMADDPEEQQEFISEAYRSALHLLNIINDVLDIAKIEAGKMQIDFSPVKLNELLDAVAHHTQPQAEQKNLYYQIKKPQTYDEILVFGNYQRLLQVMLNLVGNAIKFTHEGGVSISAEVVRQKVIFQNQEFPGMVVIRVADTGIGVPLDKQDRLFQSFSQVDSSRTRQYGGTGLGLAISQKLIEAMGGTINFYSMGEGLGSTVTFTILLYQEPVMISEPGTDSLDLLLEM